MIVKCIRNDRGSFHPCAFKALTSAGVRLPEDLDVGREYVCYGLGIVDGSLGFFLVTGEVIRQPMFYPACFFEIVDARMPPEIRHSVEGSRHFFLPKIFSEYDGSLMWDLADDVPEAIRLFSEYRQRADRAASECD